jgi:molybdate transport system ATP-binding protein
VKNGVEQTSSIHRDRALHSRSYRIPAISSSGDERGTLFELSSKNIILFKGGPVMISAHNILKCIVVAVSRQGITTSISTVGQPPCGGGGQAGDRRVGHKAGREVYAAIKATVFRKLG